MRKSLTIILSNNLKIEKMQRINFEKQKKQLTFPFIEKKGLNLAKKYNKQPAQIILKWLLQRNIVVIPKSVTPSRIQANIDVIKI